MQPAKVPLPPLYVLSLKQSDVPTILTLIHLLAAYEHATSSVEATPETLLATISFASSSSTNPTTLNQSLEPITPTRPARCLLVFSPSSSSFSSANAEAVGFALYFHNYSTWRAAPGIYLEDLFIREEERAKGYGFALMTELAKITRGIGRDGGGEGGKRFEWSVLKWNEPSIRWYEDVLGAKRMEEWVGMRVDGVALEELAGSARKCAQDLAIEEEEERAKAEKEGR